VTGNNRKTLECYDKLDKISGHTLASVPVLINTALSSAASVAW